MNNVQRSVARALPGLHALAARARAVGPLSPVGPRPVDRRRTIPAVPYAPPVSTPLSTHRTPVSVYITVNTQNTCLSVHHSQHTGHQRQHDVSTHYTCVNVHHCQHTAHMCQDDVNIHHCQHTEKLSTHTCQPCTSLSHRCQHTAHQCQHTPLSTHSPPVSTYTTVNKHTAD